MNENSSQTIKELSEDQEIKNSSELDNDSASQNEEDLSFEKSDIPSADSSSSRTNNDFDNAGFTQEEFASLLGKYDYNFKPGDLVKGTVFALEPKGAMIDIGAKTAAFMPVQEVSINRVEGLNDVLQPSESREFFIMSEENEDGQLALSIRRIEYQRAWERVRQLQKEDATIYSEVFATNRGGALVRVEGLRGFIPGSHISARKIKDDLEGEYLPLKLNAGGVMPIIFASALIFLPITIANVTGNPVLIKLASSLNPGSSNPWPYALTFFSLILGFSYFYASLTINPIDVASNLKKGGVAIPGVRPGTNTANSLSGIQNRLTLLGGLFLGSVAIIPSAVERATNVQTFQGLGATSLLILVGVAIDTAKQIQTYVISQRYEGLINN